MRKRVAVGAVAVVLLIGGAVIWQSRAPAGSQTPTPSSVVATPTPPSIRAKGTILASRQTKLSFGSGGRVAEVSVRPGDVVKAGQALATLDARDLELQVKSAEDTLALAQVSLEQISRSASPEELAAAEAAYAASEAHLKELTQGSDQSDVLAAESALETARQQLAQAEASASADERIARANLDSAKAKLSQLKAGPSADDVASAELQVEQAKLNLWSAQIARDGLAGAAQAGYVQEYEVKAREAQLAASELGVRVAEQNLAKLKAGPTAEDLAVAQAAVDQAQAQLDVKLATRAQSLASAQSAVTAAESHLERVKAGSTESEIKSAESGVARDRAALAAQRQGGLDLDLRSAKLKVSQAEGGLAQAKLALDGAKLVAPYDAVVASVMVAEHDATTPGAVAIVVADPTGLRVESTDLDESAVSSLSIGQPVKVTMTAFDDKVLTGKVAEITPLATTSDAGDVSYPVLVSLDQRDPEVRWGMTARLEFLPMAR